MSTVITTCPECKSMDIKEINPEQRDVVSTPLCKITGECNECKTIFEFNSWTKAGKRRGILY